MADIKCRILCVDDHQDTSEMLLALLSQEDYEVEVAYGVEEALQRAKSEKFDLYVLDKRLPDGSGLELCQKLHDLGPSVPCIFYSGDAYEVHRREAMAAGADAYVAKPDIDSLIESVHRILANEQCATAAE